MSIEWVSCIAGARLIDNVTSAVKCGKPFAHGSVKLAHLEIALSWSEHRALGPEIFMGARH
jgi:hypothetical protein